VAFEFTDEQLRAIERRDGSLLVRAGAGTGKTAVLVERFVRAVLDDGCAVDAVLAITFTEKAAAQLRARVRERLLDLGERRLAREAERAWISTIHGLCARILRAHALAAGIDPEVRVLDELEAERLRLDAFDRALSEFLRASDPTRLELAANYTPDQLADMVRTAHAHLRSRGERFPELPEREPPGDPAGAVAAVLDAARAASARLGGIADPPARVEEALGALSECLGFLERAAGAVEPAELRRYELKKGVAVLREADCDAYRDALERYASHCAAAREHRDHSLLRELLRLYGERYEALKQARSGLDFEDLELGVRDLLRADDDLRRRHSERFEHVMVDEFQDVNPLQSELVEMLGEDRLFRVGDEAQSIYRFRHADVGVFEKHHAQAAADGRSESLTVSFRARGELVDAIGLAFGELWGERFQPLRERPGAREHPVAADPPIDLLVVDTAKPRWEQRFPPDAEPAPFGEALRGTPLWRACEARLLARRVDELAGHGGPYSRRDVVLLLRATTHMGVYERALEERGVPTHVVGARGYWAQQQVGDLRAYLAVLANPLDELALLSALGSPLGGATLDGLTAATLHARRLGRNLWWALSEAFGDGGDGSEGLAQALPEPDRERVRGFVRRLAAERAAAPRMSLERLIDAAVTASGYDTRVLSQPAGDRRLANVRKLMRMAREFEADEGRDLRGFIDAIDERDLIGEREGEAPLEAEDLDAVRIMTVHRAKGLEFPVVCVADLGKQGREDNGALRISDDGSTGLRLATAGAEPVRTEALERIRAEQKLRDEEEERRIFYVAATRAQEHLVLSGATDLEKLHEPESLTEPMRWVWRSFAGALPEESEAIAESDYEGHAVRVRCRVCRPALADDLLSPTDRVPAPPRAREPEPVATPPLELGAVAAPAALAVSRLSYSALEGYRRCGYRFYLDRALRLPGGEDLRPGRGAPAEPPAEGDATPLGELSPRLRGTVVHELLERLDPRRPVVPTAAAVAERIAGHGVDPRQADVEDARELVAAFAASALRERLAAARRVRSELPFAFTLAPAAGRRSLLVNGVVDVLAEEPGRTLVVDYKTDRLDGADPRALCDAHYATQRIVYALAALRSGAELAEVAYVFLAAPEQPVFDAFPVDRAPELEGRLLELAEGVVAGRYEPTAEPHRELCASCPGQPSLCRWEPEMTLRERPGG
jgi:ATP-dependent exoDNAse (exonuclease V) beta subunit